MGVARFIDARAAPPEPEPLITAAALAEILEVDSTTAERLAEVVTELVERYAPGAPDVIKREAAIRCAGWLSEAPSAGVRSETAGPFSTDYTPSMTSALRHSGAMALLSPRKVRRAGVIA